MNWFDWLMLGLLLGLIAAVVGGAVWLVIKFLEAMKH